jgi:hypothetical protein
VNDVGGYYLRRCGEDGLLRRRSSDDLRQRARALAAVDVVSPAAAAKIVADYDQARALRGLIDDNRHSHDEIADEWTAPTIRPCGQTLHTQWGEITVHYVIIGAHESGVEVTMTQSPTASGTTRRRGAHGPVHDEAPDLDIVDEHGNALPSGFNGGGNSRHWAGRYRAHSSLDPAAVFITVMGHRVELGPVPSDVAVRIEELDPSRPTAELAARYLRRCLAAPSRHYFEQSPVPTAIDTFLALGILTPDAEEIVRAGEAEKAAEEAVPGISPRGARHGRSTRSRPRPRRADRTVGVSVSLPSGVHIAITDLRSTSDGVTVGFQAAVTSLDSLVRSLVDCFAMSTTDEAGVEHPGELNDWGGGGGTFHGRMTFPAPLDSAAPTFTLRLLTDRADVTLDIPWPTDGAQ